MNARLIDSHVNLHSEKYADDLEDVIANAQAAGVYAMLTISDKLSSTDAIKNISEAYDFVWRSVGVHPHYAADDSQLNAKTLIDLAAASDVVGIGECGLDFHYEYSDREIQRTVFAQQIIAAQETMLPLIIHTRDADDEMQTMLERAFSEKKFVPLLHCYTGGPKLAKSVLDMGGYISFSGIISFKNADDVRAIAEHTPLDRIIIETDCPYLAPVPKRGRRNEPAYLVHVAEKLAEIRNVDVDEIAEVTTRNFFDLFSKATLKDTSS